jgi:tetratricopeptide (TPR) repeat protein
LDKTIIFLTKTIELDPLFPNIFASRGNAYYGIGEFDLAILDYLKAIDLNPKDGLSHFNLGKLYKEKGDHEKAERYLALSKKLAQR